MGSHNSEFNDKKFKLMVMEGMDRGEPYTCLDRMPIKTAAHMKNLGIFMSEDLKFDYHISNLVKKGQKISAWVLKTFRTRQVGPMMILLKSLIISTVEYGSILWAPSDHKILGTWKISREGLMPRWLNFESTTLQLGSQNAPLITGHVCRN